MPLAQLFVYPGRYVLENGKPVPEPDLERWRQWFEPIENRRVGDVRVGHFRVSTVFLGLDHNFLGEGEPILWETMVWWRKKGKHQWIEVYGERCSGDWTTAKAMHATTCGKIVAGIIFFA